MKEYLRHREHGEILDMVEALRDHPKLEVVSEIQAYPERFAPENIPEEETKRRGRPRVRLETPDVPVPPPIENEDQNIDASRRLKA